MKTRKVKVRNFVAVLALSVGTLFSGSIAAQEQQTSAENGLRSKFGIKAGLNLANLYVDDVKDENFKAGFNAGLFAKLPVTRGFSIQPELLYSNKGAKLSYDAGIFGGEGEYRFNLHYVELPVLAVINVVKNLNIHAGPYVSYLAGANITRVNDDNEVNDITDLKADNFNRIDYGLAGGIGLDFQNLTVGARYNYGLREIGESGLSGQITKNSKNSVINVYLGFAF
ncbi:MAG: PorT family protein [Sphingobacteriales bacterium]|nr:MAG: PorT family protein [Sphingobacteriales bacterium]